MHVFHLRIQYLLLVAVSLLVFCSKQVRDLQRPLNERSKATSIRNTTTTAELLHLLKTSLPQIVARSKLSSSDTSSASSVTINDIGSMFVLESCGLLDQHVIKCTSSCACNFPKFAAFVVFAPWRSKSLDNVDESSIKVAPAIVMNR